MYNYKKPKPTTLTVNNAYEGETIEMKVRRFMNNQEPIKDASPLIYTDRKDGVQPAYNIRTDRMELAQEAMDKVTKAKLAARENRQKPKETDKKDGGAEPIQTTTDPKS